jgi:hypothetical protein
LRPKSTPLTRRRRHSPYANARTVKQRSHNPRDAVKRGRLRPSISAGGRPHLHLRIARSAPGMARVSSSD